MGKAQVRRDKGTREVTWHSLQGNNGKNPECGSLYTKNESGFPKQCRQIHGKGDYLDTDQISDETKELL